MNRPAAAYACGLLVGAATATAAWVRLAGHPVSSAATRAQLAAIQVCIRALEALPTQPGWDDDDGTPQRRGQDGPLGRRDPATGTPGGSMPVQARTGRSGAVTPYTLGGEAATAAADMCPQCHRDNTQPWDLCADCAAGNAQAAEKSYAAWLDAHRREDG